MLLVELGFVHYSPKDSEQGVKELIVCRDLAQAVEYIDQEHMFDALHDAKNDHDNQAGYRDEGSHSLGENWFEQNQAKKIEAEALGLKVETDEFDDSVEGPSYLITTWLRSTAWTGADDAYYGVTHWDWSKSQPIADEDVAVLLRLGLAKDIRGFTRNPEA